MRQAMKPVPGMFPATPPPMRANAKAEIRPGSGAVEELLARRTRELNASEARFLKLLESVHEPVFLHDAGGCILIANAAAAHLAQRPPTNLRGTALRDLVAPDDGERMLAAWWRAAVEGAASCTVAFVVPAGGAVEATVVSHATEVEGDPALLSIVHEKNADANADDTRVEFMSVVAHDVRNPLAVVLGYADMLRELGDLGDEREAMLARLTANARWAISLVANYLDLARVEAGRLALRSTPVDLNEVLDEAGDIYGDEARRKQIRLDLELQAGLPQAQGDANALARIFANLIHSALKHTPENGRITLRSAAEGDQVLAQVVDDGEGIPAEEVSILLDCCARPRAGKTKNSGLGLFIAKALVEAQGGSMSVDNRPGAGTGFTVRLPRAG